MSSFEDRLSKLTEFNPAIVYSFQAEDSPLRTLVDLRNIEEITPELELHITGYKPAQVSDMLDAYLFAQEFVVSLVPNGIGSLSNKNIQDLIFKIHAIMGHTLLSPYKKIAGQYADEQVIRMHYGAESWTIIELFLNQGLYTTAARAKTVKTLKETCGINETLGSQFLELVLKYGRGPDTATGQNPQIDTELFINACNTQKLSANERQIVDQMLELKLLPEEIPAAVEQYIANLQSQWPSLAALNRQALSLFLAENFYQFTKIHPFINGNGRVATCLTNIILRSLGLPSIIIRLANERGDGMSAYEQAMSQIEKSREPFAKLIASRIAAAENHTTLIPLREDQAHRDLAITTDTMVTLMEAVYKQNKQRLQPIMCSLETSVEYERALNESKAPEQQLSEIELLSKLRKIFNARFKSELAGAKAPQSFFISSPTKEQISAVKTKLAALTGLAAWKSNANAGLKFWLDNPETDNVDDIVQKLKATQAMQVELRYTQDGKRPIILCTDLALDKILAIQPEPQRIANKP